VSAHLSELTMGCSGSKTTTVVAAVKPTAGPADVVVADSPSKTVVKAVAEDCETNAGDDNVVPGMVEESRPASSAMTADMQQGEGSLPGPPSCGRQSPAAPPAAPVVECSRTSSGGNSPGRAGTAPGPAAPTGLPQARVPEAPAQPHRDAAFSTVAAPAVEVPEVEDDEVPEVGVEESVASPMKFQCFEASVESNPAGAVAFACTKGILNRLEDSCDTAVFEDSAQSLNGMAEGVVATVISRSTR